MEGLVGIIAIIIYFIILGWWREKQRIARRDYYREYLKTDDWQRKRYIVLKRDNWICQKCGAKANQVHHKKYARRIGKEPIKWLISVCTPCHNKIHS
jgi:5-methylcytosine-specific restriction endonuclease McrA